MKHVQTIRRQALKSGLLAHCWSDEAYLLIRKDGKPAKTIQRSLKAFCAKYHIARIYHYSTSLDGPSRIEVSYK